MGLAVNTLANITVAVNACTCIALRCDGSEVITSTVHACSTGVSVNSYPFASALNSGTVPRIVAPDSGRIGRRAGAPATPLSGDGATVADLVQRVVLSSHNGVVLLDRMGDVVLANPPAVELGLVQGSRPDERARKAAEQVRDTGEVVHVDLSPLDHGVRSGRGPTAVLGEVRPLGDEFTVIDASDESDAVRLEATRRDFVANVSHELKTPVGAMGVLAEALQALGLVTVVAPEDDRSGVSHSISTRHPVTVTEIQGRAVRTFACTGMPADCVVVGLRWKEKGKRIATLLLGLYRKDGGLDYVGSCAVGAAGRAQGYADPHLHSPIRSQCRGCAREWVNAC